MSIVRIKIGYILLLLIALLLFGKNFTKYQVAGPLYLYDLFLVLLVFASLRWPRVEVKYKYAFYFSTISVLYFIVSLVTNYGVVGIDIIIRQFAICGYFISAYLIVMSLDSENNMDSLYRTVIVIAKISFLVQAIYIIYLLLSGQSAFEGYNYYSPLVIMGLLVFVVYTCFRDDIGKLYKSVLVVITVCLIFTSGHASALMPLFVFFITVLSLRLPKLLKPMTLLFGIALIVATFALQTYVLDMNSMWRIVYWKQTLSRIIFDRYVIFGHGFGVEYVESSTHDLFLKLFYTNSGLDKEGESFVKSVHNSFLAIAFHVGFLPIVWLSVPIARAYKFKRQILTDERMTVIFFSLIVLSVWCFFNVILELPHSSLYYWLFYFMLAAMLNNKCKNEWLLHER